MHSTTLKICKLEEDYPQFNFKPSDNFFWSFKENTIFYVEDAKNQFILALHELSHALLKHNNFNYDVELISMERQAWDYAKDIALKYEINIPDQFIQSNLDSYRNWMHMRSTCINCKAIGVQCSRYSYKCPACKQTWKVNDARECNLKRYSK